MQRENNFLDTIIIPALAGFQSEHEVEIPFMLTTEKNSENHSAGIKTAAH